MDDEIRAILRAENEPYELPAVAAGAADARDIIAAGAIGVPMYGRDGSVTTESRFHLGSITKSITATAIATVVEAGGLTWTVRPCDLFPELRDHVHPALQEIQLRHLLMHRAGIQPFEEDEELEVVGPFAGTPRDQRAQFAEYLLLREPFATPIDDFVYSNAGYAIAAAMAERATNTDWESLVRDRVLRPLGLDSAGVGWPALHHPDEPWGHVKRDAGWSPHPPDDAYQLSPLIAPAGDLHMSLLDLLRYGQMHLRGLEGEGGVIRAETIRFLHTPAGDYSCGWNEKNGISNHSGSAGTFFAVIVVRPTLDRVHAFLTNGWEGEGKSNVLPAHIALATEVLRQLREHAI